MTSAAASRVPAAGPGTPAGLLAVSRALVPRAVIEYCSGARAAKPRMPCVVVLLDISGFTSLCERYSGKEDEIESLCDHVNLAFSREIEVVQEYGGEVVSFTGDGLLCYWTSPEALQADPDGPAALEEEEEEPMDATEMSKLCARALTCSLEVQRKFEEHAMAHGMKLRIAVACGRVAEYFVGIGARPVQRPGAAAGGGAGTVFNGGSMAPLVPGAHEAFGTEPGEKVASALVDGSGRVVPGRMSYFVAGEPVEEARCGAGRGGQGGGAEAWAGAQRGAARGGPGEVAVCDSVFQFLPRSAFLRQRRKSTHVGRGQGRGAARGLAGDGPLERERLAAAGPGEAAGTPASPAAELIAEALAEARREPATPLAPAGPAARSKRRFSLGAALRFAPFDSPAAGAGGRLERYGGLLVLSGELRAAVAHDLAPFLEAELRAPEAPPPLALSDELVDQLLLFVPYAVRSRLDHVRQWWAEEGREETRPPSGGALGAAGHDVSRFISEFRSVSVLFLKLQDLEMSPETVQRTVQTLQAVLYAHEGSLRQCLLDDKGLVFIGVFGLFPMGHEDDAARSIACAADTVAAMRAQGARCAIGIASGLVYCTFVGSRARCEFSVFGSAVNRAARLMGKAAETDAGFLLDDATFNRRASWTMPLAPAGSHELKGMGTVQAFGPAAGGRRASQARRVSIAPGPPAPTLRVTNPAGAAAPGPAPGPAASSLRLVGREREAEEIAVRLQALARRKPTDFDAMSYSKSARSRPKPQSQYGGGVRTAGGTSHRSGRSGVQSALGVDEQAASSVLVLEGPSGYGKSTLVRHAVELAEQGSISVVASSARSALSKQPYHVWRGVFQALFPLHILQMGPLASEEEVELLPMLVQLLHLDPSDDHSVALSRHVERADPARSPSPAPTAGGSDTNRSPPNRLAAGARAESPPASPTPSPTLAPATPAGIPNPFMLSPNPPAGPEPASPAGPGRGAPGFGRTGSLASLAASSHYSDAGVGVPGAPPRKAPARRRVLPRQLSGVSQATVPTLLDEPATPGARALAAPPSALARKHSDLHSHAAGSALEEARGGPSHAGTHARLPRKPSDFLAGGSVAGTGSVLASSLLGVPSSVTASQEMSQYEAAVGDGRTLEARGSALRALMVRILLRRAATGLPLCVVLDDMNWADSQSWSVLLDLALQLADAPESRLFLLTSTRPPAPSEPAAARALERLAKIDVVSRVTLGPLGEGETAALAAAALGCSFVPRPVANFVYSQTTGFPFLVVHVALAILQQGFVELERPSGNLVVKRSLRPFLQPGDAVRAALCPKFDRLSASQSLTLKLAAVAGLRFTAREVLCIHPRLTAALRGPAGSQTARAHASSPAAAAALAMLRGPAGSRRPRGVGALEGEIGADIQALADADIVREAADEEEGASQARAFEFVHSAFQEVAYGLLSVSERRQMHAALASYHEQRYVSAGRAPQAPPPEDDWDAGEEPTSALDSPRLAQLNVLVHHLVHSGEERRATGYLERCARAAFDACANLEASRLLEDLLRVTAGEGGERRLARARWSRARAQVLRRQGLFREAAGACQEGLRLLHRTLPVSGLVRAARVGVAYWRTLLSRPPDLHRLIARNQKKGAGAGPAFTAEDGEECRLLHVLAYASFVTGDAGTYAAAAAALFRACVQREARGVPYDVLAVAIGTWSALLAFRARPVEATRWARLAWSLAAEIDRPQCWSDVLESIALPFVAAREFRVAQSIVASWEEITTRSESVRDAFLQGMVSAVLHPRSPGYGTERLMHAALQLQRAMERSMKHVDLADDFQRTTGVAAWGSLMLAMDRAPQVVDAMEAFLQLHSIAAVGAPYRLAFLAVYATALVRSGGLCARTWEEQEVLRVALEAAGLAREVPPGAFFLAEPLLALLLTAPLLPESPPLDASGGAKGPEVIDVWKLSRGGAHPLGRRRSSTQSGSSAGGLLLTREAILRAIDALAAQLDALRRHALEARFGSRRDRGLAMLLEAAHVEGRGIEAALARAEKLHGAELMFAEAADSYYARTCRALIMNEDLPSEMGATPTARAAEGKAAKRPSARASSYAAPSLIRERSSSVAPEPQHA
eukprot:tig00021612_g22857.t1